MEYRLEKDALGTVQVPASAYYGIQTVRAQENFPISGRREHPRFVEAFVMIKKAAALANSELGLLKPEIAQAIVQAADEVLAGQFRDQFLVDVFHQGAGTSFNMNVNEVLANRAIEILGGKKGDYSVVHPNDHVNMAQSTNDTFPTAMRVATRKMLEELFPVVEALRNAFYEKGKEFDAVVKSARTHLQDAVPIRLGQEFTAYGVAIDKALDQLKASATSIEELGIGGSAAGTGLNTHPGYRFKVIRYLKEWTGFPFRPASDMREAMQSHLPNVHVSSALRMLAIEVSRICNDLRLMASGPTTGFNEIFLPAVQPGSSIMPGKVNPSIPEMVNMVCFQVIGNDTTVAWAASAGQLELNVMMPVMIYNLLESIEIMKNACAVLREKCILGIRANEAQCRRYAEMSNALATALNPYIGYARAAEVAKEAVREGKTIKEVVLEKGLLPPDQVDKVLDPIKMTEPGIPGKID